jgi:zinc protease
MSISKRLPTLLLVAALIAGGSVYAQQAAPSPAETAPLTQQIPVDPLITTGQLSNGLRYYVRANNRPEQRAEVRLVVNAGSILEDADQQGLAHFVEHMAFNGTKNFPKQDVIAFMQSIGMRFGAHVNAYTSFDETVYMLQVPTDKPEVLRKAFQILEDWARNVSFEPAEVDKERGVVVEEWRLGRGAGARMLDAQFPVLLKGSRYAERLPIGKKEILENFKHDRLKKFYTDWYRPNLMAVVAVGDFDKAAVEGMIKERFSGLTNPAPPRPRLTYEVPDHLSTLYTIATDKEATQTSVSVYSKMTLRDQRTVGAYRRQIVENLFAGMLNARFTEITQKPDSPFLGASAGRGLFVRSKEASILNAAVKEDGIERGLEALFAETERVVRHGFTAPELDRQKRNTLRGLERAVAEKDNQQSAPLAAEFIRNFLQEEPIPGIVYENQLYQRFVPDISLGEVNGLAKEWAPDGNRVVVVNAPQKDGLAVPDEKKLAAAITAAAARPLQPYVDTTSAQPLMETPPAGGTVVKTSAQPEFEITEWQLSNGVKVVLKPTNFKQDEVLFRAFSPGGTSLAADPDYVSATTSAQVVQSGGLATFSALELQKMLTGKVASASASISETEEMMAGGASRKDLETMFQLIYLRFTQPRADETIFGVMTSQTKAALANQKSMPEFAFAEALEGALSQNHFRSRPFTAELVDEMSLAKSLAFYKDRFADASDFTFTFIGSFDLPTLKPLVERYLGGLPSLGRKETWKDVGPHPPRGIVTRQVAKGIEPKSQAALVFTGPFKYDQTNRIAIRAMSLVLENRLRDVLREDLGGTYGVGVSPSYDKFPRQEFSVSIDFGANPDRLEALIKTVFDQIELLKKTGPTDQQVADVKEGLLRDFEQSTKQNGYLLNQISLRYQFGEELKEFFGIPDLYRKITAATIQDAARLYLDTNNYVRVTLMPEKK